MLAAAVGTDWSVIAAVVLTSASMGVVIGAIITVVGARFLIKPYERQSDKDREVLISSLAAGRAEHQATIDRLGS